MIESDGAIPRLPETQNDDRRGTKVIQAIAPADVPALFAVSVATRENALSRAGLKGMGITEESVTGMLADSHRGWLTEHEGRVVGFAMGNG